MVTLIEAANRFGITKHQMYMRLKHLKDTGRPASIHNGQHRTVMVDLSKLNMPYPEEKLELEQLYFEVSDKLGDQFNVVMAKKLKTHPNSIRSYFNTFHFIKRDVLLKYTKALKELV